MSKAGLVSDFSFRLQNHFGNYLRVCERSNKKNYEVKVINLKYKIDTFKKIFKDDLWSSAVI